MKLIKTNIENCYKILAEPSYDNRGFFSRIYCKEELKLNFDIKQINISQNKKKGTLRGFHYQKIPSKEHKIISCIEGAIFNVTIDLRPNSKTYKKIYKTNLKSNDLISLHIPSGCANCFLTTKDNTKILYFMNDFYKHKNNLGFNYNSKILKINWPTKIKLVSKKDSNLEELNKW